MARSFSMRGVQGAADRAVQHARPGCWRRLPARASMTCRLDPRFQHRGVDLLWELPTGEVRGIEVKGDRQTRPPPLLVRAGVQPGEGHPGLLPLQRRGSDDVRVPDAGASCTCCPLKDVREWFLPRAKAYALKHTSTKTGAIRYTTVGAVVNCRDVLEAVPSALCIPLKRAAGKDARGRGDSGQRGASVQGDLLLLGRLRARAARLHGD